MDTEKELDALYKQLGKESREAFNGLILKSIVVLICTFGICWAIKGLTSYDLFDYFKYVYVLYWIISITLKPKHSQ